MTNPNEVFQRVIQKIYYLKIAVLASDCVPVMSKSPTPIYSTHSGSFFHSIVLSCQGLTLHPDIMKNTWMTHWFHRDSKFCTRWTLYYTPRLHKRSYVRKLNWIFSDIQYMKMLTESIQIQELCLSLNIPNFLVTSRHVPWVHCANLVGPLNANTHNCV